MGRKTRQGYFVAGEFVVAGSTADEHHRQERKGTSAPSRTELKQASEQLQALGERLLTLSPGLLDSLSMPDKLREAIAEAERITSIQALRRQKQFIGRLMHLLGPDELAAVRAALEAQHARGAQDAGLLHEAEAWRDALVADEARLGDWLRAFPDTDAQRLRSLLREQRNAASDSASDPASGQPRRHGKAYRQILRLLREQLSSSADSQS